ncbi:Rtr1/RPAP2 family-domain-containing protein [Peziza echinospora]|nr:Rtr1/RPAP2 family-domain-containing protein [Peziza echinospora]
MIMSNPATPLKSILKKPNASSSPNAEQKPTKTAKVKVPPETGRPPKQKTTRRPAAANTVAVSLDSNTIAVSQGTIGPNGKRLPTPEEAREIALYHANIIQTQKDFEFSILNSIELLLDFPTTANHASKPSESDIFEFKKNIQHFRPSDYDDLIEERNIISKCGYALCPEANRRQPTKARFRVLDKGKRIVETKQLERFCGEDCARRGLWIRVQLSEEAPWQRIGPSGEVGTECETDFTLLEERKESKNKKSALQGDVKKLADQLQTIGISGTGIQQPPAKKDAKPVAASTLAPFPSTHTNFIELVKISERTPDNISQSPEPPSQPELHNLDARMAALSVEGYTPAQGFSTKWREVQAEKDEDSDAE